MSIYKSEAGAQAVRTGYEEYLRRWPVECRHSHVPTRQGTTFVVVCGPEDAPPLLLLHGSHGNAAMWSFDVPAWAQHFRVHAVDVIGEPGFSAPSRPPLESDAYCTWLEDVMEGLGLARAALLGESLGGWLAVDYATRRPQRVDSLVLLCPAGIGRARNFKLKALPLFFMGDWGMRKLREMALGRLPEDLPPPLRDFLDFTALIFKHFNPRMVKLPLFSDEALQRLTMPVLALLGGRDALLDSDDTRNRLRLNVPHAVIDYRAEAGHLIADRTGPILDFLRNGAGVAAQAAPRNAADAPRPC